LRRGINDVGVDEIISPIATSDLSALTKTHGYDDMKVLLRELTGLSRMPL